MKEITLLRHAKSSWEDTKLRDFDRPLIEKGMEDCKTVKKEILKEGIQVKRLYCSAALRTRQTSSLVFPDIKTSFLPELYLCTVETVYNSILALKNKHESVALVFHNFAITDFVNEISIKSVDNIKTAGLIHIQIDGDWSDIYHKSKLKVRYFDREKWIDLNP